jgi:hypothetical protein
MISLWASGIKPTLSLNFAGANTLDSLFTFTRSGAQTYFDSTGTLQTATTNVAAFDYDPSTLAPLGLSMWEARTNSLRNNTMAGASAGTPGTNPTNWALTTAGGNITTKTIVGVGTENGISYIDVQYVFSGAATGAVQFESSSQIVAAISDVWSQSVYVRLVGGSLSNMQAQLITAEATAAGAFLAATTTNFTPTVAALNTQRIAATRTLNQATVARVYGTVFFTASGAADVTLRIGMPQLELGAFATPVITTTTAAATRAAPVCSTTNLGWYNATEGTLVSKQTRYATAIADGNIYEINDGTSANRISGGTGASGSVLNPFVIVSNVAQATLTQGAGSVFNTHTMAIAIKANDFAASTDGAAVVTDVSGTMPTVTTLTVGKNSGAAASWNGWISSLTYYPLRLPNATLQTLST